MTTAHPMQRTFDELRRARRDDATTSKAAARASHGLAGRHRALILAALAAGEALTAHEIAARCELTSTQVSRRLGQMRDDGDVVTTDEVRATPTGRPAQCWRCA